MSGSEEEPGTTEEQVGISWEDALSATITDQAESETESTVEAVQTVPEEDAAPAKESVEQDEPAEGGALAPIETWTDEFKERFQTLEPDVQQFLLDRHAEMNGDYTRKTQELAETRQRYESYDPVLKPYEELASQQGLDLAPVLANALQAYVAYVQDPAGTLKALVSQSAVTAEQLGLVEDDLGDPTIKALQNEIAALKQSQAQQQTSFQQQEQQSVTQSLDSFKNELDEQGNLKHPHFEALRVVMANAVESGQDLESAYQQAVWSIPDYREAQLKSQADKALQEKLEALEKEKELKLSKAKKAGDVLPSQDTPKSTGVPSVSKDGKTDWGKALQVTMNQGA